MKGTICCLNGFKVILGECVSQDFLLNASDFSVM